jgi:HEPN domain-containing protein
MTDQNKIDYWVDIADYDLKTAEAMLETGRYLYVGFMCHQAIEKYLKAHFVKTHNTVPPYTHNLLYLAEKVNIYQEFNDIQKDFLDYIVPFNIRTRYPSDKEELYRLLNKKKCEDIINQTKEFTKWIKNKL